MIWGERIKLRRLELGDIEKMANWKMNEDPLFSDYNFPLFTPAEQKLSRLLNYVKKNGSLEGRDGPQLLDVSQSRSMRISRLPVSSR